jgi:hypothetical protein
MDCRVKSGNCGVRAAVAERLLAIAAAVENNGATHIQQEWKA